MSESNRPPRDPDEMSPSERRLGYRHLACFPAYVERPDGEKRTAMIHDLSVTGALLLVRTELNVDDSVRLELFVTGDPSESRVAVARVVRVERLGPMADTPWSHRIAVQFDEPLADYAPQIEALAKRQRELGLRP
jgi:hypothetical protein